MYTFIWSLIPYHSKFSGVGAWVGDSEGEVGIRVGKEVGVRLGTVVGKPLGLKVGVRVGLTVGDVVGL